MNKFYFLVRACLLGIFLLGLGWSAAAQGTWTQKANFGSARIRPVGFSIGGKGYVGTGGDFPGGDPNRSVYFTDFWEFNPATNAWTQKANFGGSARYGAVGFSIGGKGYVGTGSNFRTAVNFTDFWEFDPTANAWTRKANFGGSARSGAVGFSIGGKGYVGTGISASNFADFWEFNPATNAWTQKANFGGSARSGAVGFSIGGKGYVGAGASNTSRLADFWEFEPTANAWTQKANFGGSARSNAVGFGIGDKGYVGTGIGTSSVFTDFWEFEPAANAWTQKANFGGSARGNAVGFSIGDKGYVGMGGNNGSTADFWEFGPAPVISSFTPTSGPVGTSVTVTGTNLGSASSVSFNGTNQTTFTSNSTTQIVLSVPAGATSGPLTVTTANGTSAASSQSFFVTPVTISSVSPGTGPAGTAGVVLTGTNLGRATAVTVNGAAATFSANTATSLTFTVPAGASATQSITVTTPGGTSAAYTAFVVQLKVSSTGPAANARTAAVASSPVAINFTEPVQMSTATPTPTTGIKVYSAQVGGRKTGIVGSNGNTVGFTSTLPGTRSNFMPGEVVSVSVPATVLGAGGLAVGKKVYQFATAVSGAGVGTFSAGSNPAVGANPASVAVGDVDGDGDLDLLTANSGGNSVSVRLNGGTNTGVFSGGNTLSVGVSPSSVALGDVDGDGDLDLLAANNTTGGRVSVWLNNGMGTFSAGSDPAVDGTPSSVAVGDVDGDGDLDFVTANGNVTVSVRLNGGDATGSNTGTFSTLGGSLVPVGGNTQSVALGDVDGDGDLDLLTANNNASGTVSVRLNDGAGTFSAGSNPAVGANPRSVAVGDVDGDGDLDFVTANNNASGTVSVQLNDGAGAFSAGSTPAVGANPRSVALGDVDGDGDLDLLTANFNTAGTVSVRLNDGAGIFSASSDPAVSANPASVAVGDVDGDGDLDLLTANNTASGTVSVRLNQPPPPPTIMSFTPTSGPVGTIIALTGTNLTGTTAITFAGTSGNVVSTGYTVASNTSITGIVVPSGAQTGTLTVTTAGGTSAASSQVFTVIPPPTLTAVAPNPGGLGQAITLTGTRLGSPTALTINGADALGNIISNSGTSLVVRVPATAAASGNVSLTTANATANGTATIAFAVMAPPGNALAFDGVNDHVVLPSGLNTASFTFEAWVNYQDNGNWTRIFDFGTTVNNWMLLGPKAGVGYTPGSVGNIFFSLKKNGASDETIFTSTPMPTGNWHHLAVTLATAGAVTSGTIYLDGVAIGTNPAMALNPTALGTLTYNWLGRSANGDPYLKASLDEVRVWNTARTAAEVRADMAAPAAAPFPAALAFYLNTDQGTPATASTGASTGANAGLVTLYDLVNAQPATLTNYALATGNTASNYVESYAMVVPAATAATARTATGFTANWTAPALGTVDNGYRVDVSTSSTFASAVAGSPFPVASNTATSLALTGLTAGTTYYYRVRADKTSVTGQGGPSNTVTVCPPPVAIARNASVTLDVNGNATVAATAVNNGSTANCGPAASALSVSPSSFSCTDAVPATVASALSFNGTSQYVAVGNAATVPVGNSPYTIEAWIKPTAMGDYGIIGWGNYGTANQVNALRLSPTGVINTWWVSQLSRPTASLAGAWHHVAATFDGTTRTLYVDGVSVGSDVPGTGHAVPDASNLRIGSTNNGEYFPGSIDEVRVWSVARTAAQLNTAKGVGLPGGTLGLEAYYRLNEGSGLTTADATGTAANLGTLTNGPIWTTDAPAVTNGVPVTLTVTDAGGNTATALAVVTVSVPPTPTTTWNGNESTSPLACQNWSYGQAPDAATNVVIPTGQSRYPILDIGTLTTKNLTIDNGGSFTTNDGTALQVNGSLVNGGTATFSGPVQFVGSAATQTLSNSAGFTAVEVNKPSGTVQLAQNLTINQALVLTSGTLTTTGAYQVNLDGLALLTESDASYVLGKVVVNSTLVPGTTEYFAGLGLTLTPAAGSTAPGATLVTRTTGTALTGVGTSQSILRYFDIVPTMNAGLNVTMDFAYFTHELNGIPVANLAMFKSVSGAAPWIPQRGTTAGANLVTKTGIADFSVWTLGNSANPLPVELTQFTATALGRTVQLKWRTASERNSARFEVERSADGTAFNRLGTVAAAGTSTAPREYALTDAQLPAGTATLYYRLKQVDQDGTFSYSPVRSVRLSEAAAGLALFPNPTTTGATLTGALPGATVRVYDALGRAVTSATADATGTAALALPTGLATGVYVVRTGTQALRLTVE